MGRKDDIIERVRAVAEPLAVQEGLELIDVQIGGSGRTELTLFIDKAHNPQPGLKANMPAASDAAPDDEATHAMPPLSHIEHIDDAATIEGAPVNFHEHGSRADHIENEVSESGFEAGGEGSESDIHELQAHEEMEHDEAGEEAGDDEGDEPVSIEVETPAAGLRPGVTLDDCANFSRIVSAALDVEDPVDGTYELVVSSPGIDRPLRLPTHYQRYAGQRVRVKTYAPLPDCGNRKTFVGKLLGWDDAKESVLIDVDGTEFAVPRKAISKANLDPVFEI